MSDNAVAARSPYPEEVFVERFLMKEFNLKLSREQHWALIKGLNCNKLRDEISSSYEKCRELDRSFSTVCDEVPMEWLLTHEDPHLRERGIEQQKTLHALNKIDPSISEGCSTFRELVTKWKKYKEQKG